MIERPTPPDWARTAGWTVAGVTGGLWLLLLVLLFVGFLLGAPGGEPAPTVDFDEPADEVVADAAAKFRARDYTIEQWFRQTDYNQATRYGGIAARIHVERSAGQLRMSQWPTALSSEASGWQSGRPNEFFTTAFGHWQQPASTDHWRRTTRGGIELDSTLLPLEPEPIRGSTPTVVTDNETTLVVRFDNTTAVTGDRAPVDRTARVVVAKGPDPHVRQVTTVTRTEFETTTWVYRVSNWGTAEAHRPDSIPSTTVTGILARSVRGLSRLF